MCAAALAARVPCVSVLITATATIVSIITLGALRWSMLDMSGGSGSRRGNSGEQRPHTDRAGLQPHSTEARSQQ